MEACIVMHDQRDLSNNEPADQPRNVDAFRQARETPVSATKTQSGKPTRSKGPKRKSPHEAFHLTVQEVAACFRRSHAIAAPQMNVFFRTQDLTWRMTDLMARSGRIILCGEYLVGAHEEPRMRCAEFDPRAGSGRITKQQSGSSMCGQPIRQCAKYAEIAHSHRNWKFG